MTAPAPNSPDVLCAEILAEARRESGEILQHAKTEAEKILAEASAEAEKIRREIREQAQAEAVRRKETILATVAVEAGRLRATQIEKLLESIHEEIRRRLLARDCKVHETMVALAAEAVRQMAGRDFILKLSAADHAASGAGLAGEIAQRAGRSPLNLVISPDSTVADGVVIQSADRYQIWDNRLASRLERLWPELRRQIALNGALAVETKAINGQPSEVQETRQHPEVRQSHAAFPPRASNARTAEDFRSPKPGGDSEAPEKGNL